MKSYPILFLTLSLVSLNAIAQNKEDIPPDPPQIISDGIESKKQATIKEIRRRRASQEALKKWLDQKIANYDLMENGAVHQPSPSEEADPQDWVVRNSPLAQAAAAYSIMIGKEVMVSSKVANRRINLNVLQATRREAAKAFEAALLKAQVGVINPSDAISILVDSPLREN